MAETIIGSTGFSLIERVRSDSDTEVWKAINLSLQCPVSICLLKQDDSGKMQREENFIGRARAAAGIRHSNIQFLYEISQINGFPCVVAEHVEAPTLTEIVAGGRLSVKTALSMAICIAKALQYVWDKHHLIHNHIQPSCIRHDSATGTTKLMHLGQDPRFYVGGSGSVKQGNPHYLAPEQAKGVGSLDFRTDMYSLAATLYFVLTGIEPFSHCSPREALQMQVLGTLENPLATVPSVSPFLIYVLEKMLMKSPDGRFSSWDEAIRALEKSRTTRVVLGRHRSKGQSTLGTALPLSPKKRVIVRARQAHRLRVRKAK